LRAVQDGLQTPPPTPPVNEREPDDVADRYDRLHTWRKQRAQARGVESDVILPRTAMTDLARRPPRSADDLLHTVDLGPHRRALYGDELLACCRV
jgi:ribonuclease D